MISVVHDDAADPADDPEAFDPEAFDRKVAEVLDAEAGMLPGWTSKPAGESVLRQAGGVVLP
jgi:hypothetical protein